MKTIRKVTYIQIDDVDTLQVDARVEFEDGEVAVFHEEDDLIAIQEQLLHQSKSSDAE